MRVNLTFISRFAHELHELTLIHCTGKTIKHKEHPSSLHYAVTCKEHKDFIATKRHPPSVALLHTAGHAKCTEIVSIFALLIVKAADIAAYMQAYRSKSRHLHIQSVGLCSLFRLQTKLDAMD